ncbi:AAA family ATPase [Oceanobacillus neutriphilus]|uniref:Tunicamycin resistance protein n=1 Tax=Oceanobacillus neutriphilus TaxID=531815 RepID=A0ABQ2P1W0_9BACI|nr:AAA family ATPase [Oceanobacillus neutriphilus]GGP16157.1 tunicamycin resistance protein [Oceanobacillus neutriphilus]
MTKIIWLNGAFGAGKTQTAYELHRRLENSFVYDPENIGFFLNQNLPGEVRKRDFQDYEIWREFNYKTIKYIAENDDGTIIVPVTITDISYFEEITGNLESEKIELYKFVLSASKEVIESRLKKRFERKSSWGFKQIDRCITSLADEAFGEKIETDYLSIDGVVEIIAAKTNLVLKEDNCSNLKRRIDRIKTQIKHIR